MAKRRGALGSTKIVKHPKKTKKRREAKRLMLAERAVKKFGANTKKKSR